MLIVPRSAIHNLMVQIVEATHQIHDQDGSRMTHGTIDELRLRLAALNAINTALNQVVWPEDQKITMPRPQQPPGPFA